MILPDQFAAPIDLSQRIVYFPVRHHSPACAWHVGRLIRELRPESVLIEGPRDATPLLPLLVHPETRMPVALYSTYVRKRDGSEPDRQAAYYPMCEFSPELVAIREGLEASAKVRFIDLTFPEKVEAHQFERAKGAALRRRSQSMQDEAWFSHSRLLRAACVRTGSRDPDDLWDHLYEVGYRSVDTAEFMRGVLAYCRLARRDTSEEALQADGCLAREQAMAAAIAEERGRAIVVTGGFHTVALPQTAPALPKPLKLAPEDNQLVLMRYSFEQLDRLNGYASGMPSPEFYQRAWEEQDPAQLLVEIARDCRQRNLGVSTADAIAAVSHVERLALLREHEQASREDVLDGIRSVFIKGADDAEGVPVLALARKRLAGDRVGNVPAEAGQPPIVHDFRHTAQRLKLKLNVLDETEAVLDLYRRAAHRDISRLLHRLAFLQVPFATFVRGPDFVAGEHLERIQEVWTYHWSPQTESALIERSLYGSTIEEAANSLLLERFAEAEQQGQGRRRHGDATRAARLPHGAASAYPGPAGPRRRTDRRGPGARLAGRGDGEPPGAGGLARAAGGPPSFRPARTGHDRLPPRLLRDSVAGRHAGGRGSRDARRPQWALPGCPLAGRRRRPASSFVAGPCWPWRPRRAEALRSGAAA